MGGFSKLLHANLDVERFIVAFMMAGVILDGGWPKVRADECDRRLSWEASEREGSGRSGATNSNMIGRRRPHAPAKKLQRSFAIA